MDDVTSYADEHECGQLRLAVAGEQVSLLGLPDALIPTCDGPQAVDALREPVRNLKDHAVICSRCGGVLEPELLARLADDLDFHEHGNLGHLAAFEPTPANFTAARMAQTAR